MNNKQQPGIKSGILQNILGGKRPTTTWSTYGQRIDNRHDPSRNDGKRDSSRVAKRGSDGSTKQQRSSNFYNENRHKPYEKPKYEDIEKLLPNTQQSGNSAGNSADKDTHSIVEDDTCDLENHQPESIRKHVHRGGASNITNSPVGADTCPLPPAVMVPRNTQEVDSEGCSSNVPLHTMTSQPSVEQPNQQQQQRDRSAEQEEEENEDANCPICKIDVMEGDRAVYCERCLTWVHQECLHMTDVEYQTLQNTDNAQWFCSRCKLIKANKIRWGEHSGEENIRTLIETTYDEILGWKKNIFSLPRGQCGTDFIKELTRLINLFVNKTKWQRVALSLVHIFIPIMLQKPSQKSKPRDHTKYLSSRLERWSKGELASLMAEAREIQVRLISGRRREEVAEEATYKLFVKLMMFGKVGEAAKKINNDDSIKGVHNLSDEIKTILQQKHPQSRPVDPDILLPQSDTHPQPVVYEEITSEMVEKVAKNMSGSGGPSLIDSDSWKNFLCSRVYKKASADLRQSVADLTKIMCSEAVHPDSLTEFIACRLVPLDKGATDDGNPGVRPVGVGEVLRRLVGKLLLRVIKDDITSAAGPLQTCTGIRSGIEAAIHVMREVFEDEETEAVLMVDAENAFNNLNRKAALQNIKELCPLFHQYLQNTYQKSAKLVIPGEDKYEIIYSEEGTTQGDVAAMGKYGIAIKPLIDNLSDVVDTSKCKQAWYADDSSAGGELVEMRKWWDELYSAGPKYGYFPLPKKTILIVKPEHLEKAERVFAGTGVKITCEGERHMGAVIGSSDFKEKYINDKINKWVGDVEELTKIAKEEPQAVYSSFTRAISRRWTYVQRTVPGINDLFLPLEEAIREQLIPALIGRKVSDVERRILALPVRLGGMGIENPAENSMHEFNTSAAVTKNLTEIIYNQEKDFTNYNKEEVINQVKLRKGQKEDRLKDELKEISNLVNNKMKRNLELAQEKGSGAWLSALPIQSCGYTLNKQEFRDSVCLRYGWTIPNTPSYCQCKKKNDIDHTLSCKRGGYVIMRHNKVRDLEAELMREVCHNVRVEPELIPLENNCLGIQSANGDNARPDVAGVGVHGAFDETYIDILITHPNCQSYADKPISQVYHMKEREKKVKYNERILQVEKASFIPIVGSTFGGWGNEANRFHKRIASLIADKKNERYADVMNHIRTRLRFCVLKSVLMAVRGVRGKSREAAPISSLSFNLIEQ